MEALIATTTGFAANVATNVLSGLWNKVVQVVKTAICLRQAVTDMEVQAQRLDNVVHDIKSVLDQEQKPAKRIVQAWLDRAETAIESWKSICNRYQQPKNCLICCPNCLCRCTISKDIVDWKRTVDQLHSEKQSDFPQSGDYSDHTPAAQISIEIPETGFFGNAIQSAQFKLKQQYETFYGMHNEVEEKLFQRLQWSYNSLPNDLKTCFLSFAAYPEDEQIRCQEVIENWIAEGIVKGSGRDSYLPDTAHSFINFLRHRCLIEVVEIDGVGRISVVKIHDVLRDLAIRIAEKEERCYFKAGQGICDFPVEEVDGKGWERMSLVSNDLHSLPTTFACSSLSVLLLNGNWGIKEVPGSFLRELSSLKVLDLSGTGITSLPPCVGNLKRLASLQLQSTAICELPESIGDLKELQFLNVNFNAQLLCLPERISELKRLRALHISFCKGLRHLPRGISELVSLEILTMGFSSISLDFEEDANAERKNASFKDLQSLRRLRVLEVNIKSPVKEGVMGNWSKMRHLSLIFTFRGANQDYLPEDMQAMKDLEYFQLHGCDVERLPCWVSEFRKLACLRLQSCEQLKELPAELQELPCLRTLNVRGCNKLEELELGTGFPKLQELSLDRLASLECVGAGAAASGGGGSPLPMLNTLEVRSRCPRLKRMRGGWDKLKCLEVITGPSGEWWDAIQWDDPTIKTSLECKCKLIMRWG